MAGVSGADAVGPDSIERPGYRRRHRPEFDAASRLRGMGSRSTDLLNYLSRRVSLNQILQWAKAHLRRNGQWPTRNSGPVVDAPGESWGLIDQYLYKGLRGLPGKISLVRLRNRRQR
jgi:hypothetical protein